MDKDFASVVSEFSSWGVTLQLVRTSTYYNPYTSGVSPSEVVYDVQAIVFDYTNKQEGSTTKPNTLIQTGDKQVYLIPNIDVTRVDPTTDFIVINGRRHKIVAAKSVDPTQSSPYYFELFVRV